MDDRVPYNDVKVCARCRRVPNACRCARRGRRRPLAAVLLALVLSSASLAHGGYQLNAATSTISKAAIGVGVTPLAMFVEFSMLNYLDALDHTLLAILPTATSDGWRITIANNQNLRCTSRTAGLATSANATSNIADNGRHKLFCLFTSSISRTIYFDNASSATDVTANAPGTQNKTLIGTRQTGAVLSENVGHIIYSAAIWSTATFTAQDRTDLNNGISPTVINAGNIVMYWRGCSALDVYNATLFTITDATKLQCAGHRVISRRLGRWLRAA